jgi:hypothetical protein
MTYTCLTSGHTAYAHLQTSVPALLTTFTDAHRPAKSKRLSKFLTCTITKENYAGNSRNHPKLSKCNIRELDNEELCTGSIRGLIFAVVGSAALQVTNCHSRLVNKLRHNMLQKPALTYVLLSIAVKRQSVCGVHEVQMTLPGRYVSAGTLLRNYSN